MTKTCSICGVGPPVQFQGDVCCEAIFLMNAQRARLERWLAVQDMNRLHRLHFTVGVFRRAESAIGWLRRHGF